MSLQGNQYKKMNENKKVLDIRESLLEMHQAGFIDAYRLFVKGRKNKEWWVELNNAWRKAFKKRFAQKIDEVFKKWGTKKKENK